MVHTRNTVPHYAAAQHKFGPVYWRKLGPLIG